MQTTSSPQVPVQKIARLANLPVSEEQAAKLTVAFGETLKVVDRLKSVNVANVQPTFQVTGLENILREDEIDEEKMFTQEEALRNAHETYNGYFVVPQIVAQE